MIICQIRSTALREKPLRRAPLKNSSLKTSSFLCLSFLDMTLRSSSALAWVNPASWAGVSWVDTEYLEQPPAVIGRLPPDVIVKKYGACVCGRTKGVGNKFGKGL